jgi:acyl-coenzyme A synthetase/AMP-(fatty) acid ligase
VEGTAGPLSLKKHVALRLPAYMIPDEIFFIDMLPQSYNGKVDRSALLDLAG